jgi:hypothetical protein
MHPNKNAHMYASESANANANANATASSAIEPIHSHHGDIGSDIDSDSHGDGQYNESIPYTKKSKYKSAASSSNVAPVSTSVSVSENYKNLTSLSNIKNVIVNTNELTNPHECICNNIIESIKNPHTINFLKFRDILYEILIYDLDINECIWYILSSLIQTEVLNKDNITDVLLKTFIFFQYYNNNYRPIYHLENYMYNLITTINGYKTCT